MPDQDRGLQSERTALSWQRTALSLVVVSAALAHLAFDRLGLFSLTGVLVAVPVGVWAFWGRGRRQRHAIHDGFQGRELTQALAESRDGLAPLVICMAIVAVALTAFAAVLV